LRGEIILRVTSLEKKPSVSWRLRLDSCTVQPSSSAVSHCDNLDGGCRTERWLSPGRRLHWRHGQRRVDGQRFRSG
jgi:hypothetical protein